MAWEHLAAIHERIAADAKLPSVVHCTTCHRDQKIDPADCLRHGWPTCHGQTMTLDGHVRCNQEAKADD